MEYKNINSRDLGVFRNFEEEKCEYVDKKKSGNVILWYMGESEENMGH